MILIPVKSFRGAKQRLSSVLDAQERAALARAMFEDVLVALAGWILRPPIAVVTADAEARRIACQFGCGIIEDSARAGETEAIASATRWCEARKVWRTLVIPADIPLLAAGEVESIFQAADVLGRSARRATGYSVLSPAADGRGTNAALRSPPGLFPLRFGNDSFEPHLRAARATGLPSCLLRFPGIGLDIDRPADLAALLAAENRTRSQELLRTWRVPERLARLQGGRLLHAARAARGSAGVNQSHQRV
ncbi:MAG TPA: 2-phospho-L-lactate guanylyltransferase [Terriglobia bacterium]|nr:2-phospho-L-lactate guanylyltransferase [Terriglobia bacterium]